MTATEIACLCIGAAGILTALLSLPFFCRGRALSKKCSARTTGTVQRYRIGGGNRKAISPVVAYLVDGKPYTAYRHYKGVVTSHKSGASGAGNRLLCQSGMFSTSIPPACSATAENSPQRSGPLAVPCPWSTIPAIPSRASWKSRSALAVR